MVPVITLAIPVYNAEAYIECALRSALDQDFSLPYEVLVIDDCGDDGSMAIVSQVLRQHNRGHAVRIVRHSGNQGLGAARNTAIEQAQGRYLFFLDADDWLMPECLSHLYALAEHEQADVVAGSTLECKNDEMHDRYPLADRVVRREAAGVWMAAEDIFMNIEVWNKLFSLDFLRQYGIRTVHRIMEDSVFDFVVRAKAQCIVLSSHVTLCYRIHNDSILGRLIGQKATDEAVYTYCDIVRQVKQLVAERFHDIDGIYDLYCLRLFYSFRSLRRMQLSSEQESYVETHVRGFLDFVPSIRSLHQGAFRLAYLICRLKGNDWRAFEHAYDQRYSRLSYYLKRLLIRL